MSGLIAHIGGITLLALRALRNVLPFRLERREFARILFHFGVRSLPLVVVTALVVGALMVIQTGVVVRSLGATGMIGWATGLAVFREVGPVLIGIMFSGQVGSFNAAELGLMKVTEQVEALSGLGIDPVRFLVFPRMLAMTLMLAILTVYGDLFAVGGGAMVSWWLFDLHPALFLDQLLSRVDVWEVLIGVAKAGVFGVNIAVVSCYFGLQVQRDAWEVGVAVNRSVVTSALGILAIDYLFAMGQI